MILLRFSLRNEAVATWHDCVDDYMVEVYIMMRFMEK